MAERTPRRAAALLDWLLLATFLTCACGWAFKAHCLRDGYWSGGEQYTTGCYSDAVPFWQGRSVAEGKLPYVQARMEYPVLTGGLIYVEGRITRAIFGASAGASAFLLVVTAVNAGLAMLITLLLWHLGLARARLWAWALAPPLILYVGHNWDLLAIAFTIGAIAMAERARLTGASALAALGVAAKLFPLFLLPLLALRPLIERRYRQVAVMVLAAIAAWSAVNLPIAAVAWTNWSEFFRFSGERSGTAASFWQLADSFGWLSTNVAQRNLWSAILFVGGYAAIVALGWRQHSARLWGIFPAILAWFLLTSKVWSPQFDLWLYPLFLIFCPRLRPVALFAIGDLLAYFAEFWWFAGLEGASPSAGQGAILFAALVRAAALLWIIAGTMREPSPEWRDAPTEPGSAPA